jgi:integrase
MAGKKDLDWSSTGTIRLGAAAENWLEQLENKNTRENYRCGLERLFTLRFIKRSMTLDEFSKENSNAIVDQIKNQKRLAEASKQARAACFISFTKFLARRTERLIPPAVPEKFGTAKTFFQVREKVKTPAMSRDEYQRFRKELEAINLQHRLISDVILQGAKRISEVLSVGIQDLDFDVGRITFRQSKTRGKFKETVISYPPELIAELKLKVGSRKKGFVFLEHRRPIERQRLNYTFARAGRQAGIEFRVTPHVLRATATTLLRGLNYPLDQIAKMTGTSPQQVGKYDKTDIADNPSKRENLYK